MTARRVVGGILIIIMSQSTDSLKRHLLQETRHGFDLPPSVVPMFMLTELCCNGLDELGGAERGQVF